MSHATDERQPRASEPTGDGGDTAPDSFTPTADDDDPEQATESENTAGDGAGTLSRPNGVSNVTNTGQRHKSTEQRKRRTDLRTVDRHHSWREVASACHVEAGLGESGDGAE